MPDPRPATIGPYELLGELARGGVGVVYKARDPRMGRLVVIKLLRVPDATSRRRLLREAEAMGRLQHRHVVPLHACGEHEGAPYLVLPFVSGESLQDRLSRGGPLPVDDAVRLAHQVGEGLAAAHAAGLVHRDVKPGNVLLDERGEALLTDFGIVKRTAQQTESVGLSVQGTFLGTPGYWPPEQAQGRHDEIGPPADVYGLGALLYALLTGVPPRAGPTLAATLHAFEREPTPVSTLRPDAPPWLAKLVHACLRTPLAERPPLAQVLDALQTRSAASVRGARGKRAVALVAAALVALTAAALAAGSLGGGPARAEAGDPSPPPATPEGPTEDPPPPDPALLAEARLRELSRLLDPPSPADTASQETIQLLRERFTLERDLGARVFDELLASTPFSTDDDLPQVERRVGPTAGLPPSARGELLLKVCAELEAEGARPAAELRTRCLIEAARTQLPAALVLVAVEAEERGALVRDGIQAEALATELLWRAAESRDVVAIARLSFRLLQRDCLPHHCGLRRLEHVLRRGGRAAAARLAVLDADRLLELGCAVAYLTLVAPARSPVKPKDALKSLQVALNLHSERSQPATYALGERLELELMLSLAKKVR